MPLEEKRRLDIMSVKSTGVKIFSKTMKFLQDVNTYVQKANLDYYGKKGVEALKEYTPMDSGETAEAWSYDIVRGEGYAKIIFKNDHVVGDYNVALLIYYGHLTRNGVWVEGVDYIHPALDPIIQELSKDIERGDVTI